MTDATQPPPRINKRFMRMALVKQEKTDALSTSYPRPAWMDDPRLLPKKPPKATP